MSAAKPTGHGDGRLLTVPDLSGRWNVPTSWVYAKVESGHLPHLKLGHYVRFELDAIEAYEHAERTKAATLALAKRRGSA